MVSTPEDADGRCCYGIPKSSPHADRRMAAVTSTKHIWSRSNGIYRSWFVPLVVDYSPTPQAGYARAAHNPIRCPNANDALRRGSNGEGSQASAAVSRCRDHRTASYYQSLVESTMSIRVKTAIGRYEVRCVVLGLSSDHWVHECMETSTVKRLVAEHARDTDHRQYSLVKHGTVEVYDVDPSKGVSTQ